MPEFKPEVNLEDHYSSEIWFAMGVFEALCRTMYGVRSVITSLNDGKHKVGSKHYACRAFDARVKNLDKNPADLSAEDRVRGRAIYQQMRDILDPIGFDTVFEGDHIHCEWDPKVGEAFWGRTP